MQLGLVTYNLARDWNLDKIIEMCEKTGFKGVELRTTHAHGVDHTLSQAERQEVKEKFDNSSVELVGMGTAFEYHSIDEDEVRENIEGTKEYVKLTKDIGGSGVKVRPNGDQLDHGIPKEETFKQIGEALHECGEFAEDYGIEIRVEMHGSVSEASDMAQIMKAADHNNVKICWNSNLVDVKDGSIAHDFELMKDYIGMCHITDLSREAYGEYPYRELFSKLNEINYDGFCCAEVHSPSDQPERFMRYYKALFDAYSKE
ncbi:MAG: sugar phosphate isomerase/epimerase family protein [Bacillota bacterium]